MSNALRYRKARIGPVDHQVALGKPPDAVLLPEAVEIVDRSYHQCALLAICGQIMGDTIALSGSRTAIEVNGALAVAMRRCCIRMQTGEGGRESIAAFQDIGGGW
jgi:hypothetical protein